MLTINGIEIKSAEPIEDIEATLMDRDSEFRSSSPANKVNGQTIIKAEEELQCTKSVDLKGIPNTIPNDELKSLVSERGLEWDDDLPSRVTRFVASDERVDRHGDIVRQKWALDNFEQNPLLLWSHNWDQPPIGSNLKWDVSKHVTKNYEGPALTLMPVFTRDGLGADIHRLVKSGVLKTGSVGFYPLEVLDVKDQKERDQLGLGRWGVVINNSELVEFSITSVPANPGAQVILNSALQKGNLQEQDHRILREARRVQLIQLGLEEVAKQEDQRWCRFWKDLFPKAQLEPIEEAEDDSLLADQVAELQKTVEILSRSVGDLQESHDGILSELASVKRVKGIQGVNDPFADALAATIDKKQ